MIANNGLKSGSRLYEGGSYLLLYDSARHAAASLLSALTCSGSGTADARIGHLPH